MPCLPICFRAHTRTHALTYMHTSHRQSARTRHIWILFIPGLLVTNVVLLTYQTAAGQPWLRRYPVCSALTFHGKNRSNGMKVEGWAQRRRRHRATKRSLQSKAEPCPRLFWQATQAGDSLWPGHLRAFLELSFLQCPQGSCYPLRSISNSPSS